MTVAAAAVVGGALITSYSTKKAGDKASAATKGAAQSSADATIRATEMQIAEITRQFDYQMQILQPQIQQQYNAQQAYSNLLGVSGPSAPGAGGAQNYIADDTRGIKQQPIPAGTGGVKPIPGTQYTPITTDYVPGSDRDPFIPPGAGAVDSAESYDQLNNDLQVYQELLEAEQAKTTRRGGRSGERVIGGPDQAVIDDLTSRIAGVQEQLSGTTRPQTALEAGAPRFPEPDEVTHFGGGGQPFVDPNLDPSKLAEGAAGTGVYGNVFKESPGYGFMVEEMNRATDRVGSAGGPNIGGRALMEANRRAKGLAAGEYYNWAAGRERDLGRLGIAEASDQQRGDQSYYNYLNAVGGMAGFGGGPAMSAVNVAGAAGAGAASAYGAQGGRLSNIYQDAGISQANIGISTAAGQNNAIQSGISNYITASQAGLI